MLFPTKPSIAGSSVIADSDGHRDDRRRADAEPADEREPDGEHAQQRDDHGEAREQHGPAGRVDRGDDRFFGIEARCRPWR